MSILGARLKEYRIENKLTARETAKIIGITPSQINHIEQGIASLTERSFLKVLKLIDLNAYNLLQSLHNNSKSRIMLVPKNWMPHNAKNGWTQGNYGLKKYGRSFKNKREYNQYIKEHGKK